MDERHIKIIGFLVVGAGEADRYLKNTLEEFKRLCSDVVVAGNNTDSKTEEMIASYGYKFARDDREWGKHQPSIKTDLLKRADELNPDWIVCLDADEVFAPEITREKLEELATKGEIAWHFLVINLYNDEQHFAHDVGIQRFWNIRFYKYLPEFGTQFLRKPLHCGLAPPYAYKLGWYAPYYLLHYGLMKAEDRQKKVERYAKYDPEARWKGREYYDDLKRELKMHEFNPQSLLEKLNREYVERKPPTSK